MPAHALLALQIEGKTVLALQIGRKTQLGLAPNEFETATAAATAHKTLF